MHAQFAKAFAIPYDVVGEAIEVNKDKDP